MELATAGNLARSLSRQGKHAEAEEMQREVLVAQTRVLGPEHADTLTTAGDLALSPVSYTHLTLPTIYSV